MIKFRVRELAEAQGMNLQMLSDKSGIAYSSIVDYWHDRVKRIDKKTLNTLCAALNCTPGDLIIREPDRQKPALVGALASH